MKRNKPEQKETHATFNHMCGLAERINRLAYEWQAIWERLEKSEREAADGDGDPFDLLQRGRESVYKSALAIAVYRDLTIRAVKAGAA